MIFFFFYLRIKFRKKNFDLFEQDDIPSDFFFFFSLSLVQWFDSDLSRR